MITSIAAGALEVIRPSTCGGFITSYMASWSTALLFGGPQPDIKGSTDSIGPAKPKNPSHGGMTLPTLILNVVTPTEAEMQGKSLLPLETQFYAKRREDGVVHP
jgi:hypothetical protein